MENIVAGKIFGTGQVTLPKKWREKVKTKNVIIEELPEGLLIRPLVSSFFYEVDDENFGINFPLGVKADIALKNLKKANGGLR